MLIIKKGITVLPTLPLGPPCAGTVLAAPAELRECSVFEIGCALTPPRFVFLTAATIRARTHDHPPWRRFQVMSPYQLYEKE